MNICVVTSSKEGSDLAFRQGILVRQEWISTRQPTRSKGFKKSEKTQALPDYVYNDSELSEDPRHIDPGLRNVLQGLKEEELRIIDLLYFQGYTQKEASEALEMPLGTVKTKVRKAISKLREVLGEDGLMRLLF